ncbi:MAG: DUF4421 family protein [Bdellovibrionales bacterium]|nr:DUF4421 family protein [Bdellovibrionales bacterium]
MKYLVLLALLAPMIVGAEMPAHEEFARKLSLGIGTQAQSYSFNLAGGNGLTYAPNMGSLTVFSVNYAGIGGFSYGARQGLTDDERKRGNTDFQDFRFNFPYRQFNVFVFYSRYKGMYLENSSSIDSTLTSANPYIVFPDLFTQNMGVNLTWVYQPERFSLAAIMDLSERQIKSGGSLLFGLAATETLFRSDGAVIPFQVKDTYAEDAEMYEGRVRALSAKIGYGYTDVYRRRYFLTVLGTIAAGPQQVRISTPTEDYSILRLGLNIVEAYVIAGYNGERFFTGFSANTFTATYQAKKAEIRTSLVNGGAFFGVRF